MKLSKISSQMNQVQYFIIVLLLSITINTQAERSMYVDDFDSILGNVTAENNLLNFAVAQNIETLLLYDLHTVHAAHNLTSTTTNQILADFIYKAKNTYGLTKIGAIAENAWFFENRIDAYNNTRTDILEKFDVYNLEFEFWIDNSVNSGGYYCTTYLQPNGFDCHNAGAFQFFIQELAAIKTLATNNSHTIRTEAYVGWPTAGQADTIGSNLDKVLVHAYVSDPSTSFGYSDDRLIDFANGNPNLDVSIIFSAEPNFMQSWLLNNDLITAENTFTTDWTNSSSAWTNNIDLVGFTYFAYGFMTNITLPVVLTSFDAQVDNSNNTVLLNWETSSEINSDYFEIERKIGDAAFETIGRVDAAGNSIEPLQYQFVDNEPIFSRNYYRLKQVDLPKNNGNIDVEYSETILIDLSPNSFINIISENPTNKHILKVDIPNATGNIDIFNANGQLVKTIGNIEIDILDIDIQKLAKGTYYLKWNNDFDKQTVVFIRN